MDNPIPPFVISCGSDCLKDIYPSSQTIKDVFTNSNESERKGIIRLWITEGIPFAFKDYPLVYEEVRDFIARGVNVHAKEVTLVGSGRIGYSLKGNVWGRTFSNSSDLDFTIISNDLFKRLVSDFQKWVSDVRSGILQPRTESELKHWLNSIAFMDENIPKGFINTKNLFSHDNYHNVRKCYGTMYLLKKKMLTTESAPKINDTSIRVYSDWNKCIRQVQINFKTALKLW